MKTQAFPGEAVCAKRPKPIVAYLVAAPEHGGDLRRFGDRAAGGDARP